MTYDEILAGRIRSLLVDRDDVVEKRMFGGLAFMVSGHMAVVASGRDGLMVRIDPTSTEPWLAKAGPMEMNGRDMKGWRYVTGEPITDDAFLAQAVAHAVGFVAGLPAK